MKQRRWSRLVLSMSFSLVIVLLVLAVLPARSVVPHLGYGLITYHYDPMQLANMNFGWIKLFNDPPQSPQMQSVLLRIDVTAATTLTDLQADLAAKLPFAQYVAAWEIGNEPNIDAEYGWGAPPNALAYKPLLCAAYAQIKAADPDAIVVSAGLAPTGRVSGNFNGHPGHDGLKQDDRQFLIELLDNGGGACLDVVGYHPYGYSADYNAVPDVTSADPTQNCLQGFCFRGAEKIYEIMQQMGLGDRKLWATEFGWITQPPDHCLSDPTWAGRAWQIVTYTKQASNLAGAYQYADANWPWMGAMFVFNLDFSQNPALPECEQMRYYSIIDRPAYTTLVDVSKNPASIPGKLKTDVSQLTSQIDPIDQPLSFTAAFTVSNWGWEPATYTATADTGAAIVPVLLNPTGVLNGTAQRSLLFSLASTNRVSGTYTGRITVNWTAAGVSSPGPRKVDLVLRVVDAPGLRVRNSSPTLLGQSTVFTASLTGAGVTYQWNFGDGHSGSGATVSHLYSAVGVYTAVVTATAGITAISATMPIAVVDVPITGLYAASSGFTLLGQTSAFTAGLSGGTNVAYHWTFGDGETGSGQTLTHTYALQGHYVAQVTATNSAGTATAWTALLVLDHPLDQHAYLPSIFR